MGRSTRAYYNADRIEPHPRQPSNRPQKRPRKQIEEEKEERTLEASDNAHVTMTEDAGFSAASGMKVALAPAAIATSSFTAVEKQKIKKNKKKAARFEEEVEAQEAAEQEDMDAMGGSDIDDANAEEGLEYDQGILDSMVSFGGSSSHNDEEGKDKEESEAGDDDDNDNDNGEEHFVEAKSEYDAVQQPKRVGSVLRSASVRKAQTNVFQRKEQGMIIGLKREGLDEAAPTLTNLPNALVTS